MSTTKKRIIALDVGDARIGIAISDALHLLATPHSTMERKDQYLQKLVQLIADERIGEVVVGYPINLDGSIGEQARKVENFVRKLESALQAKELSKINCVLWDERLTTVQAQEVLGTSQLKNKERSATLDKISAALILESYLLDRKNPMAESDS